MKKLIAIVSFKTDFSPTQVAAASKEQQVFSLFSRESSEKTVPVPQAEAVPLGRLP